MAIELPNARIITCVTRGKKTGVACGDYVQIKLTEATHGVIESVMPRTSLLYRSDAFREKIIAANVTQIIIVVAAVPSFYEELLNRCLIAAEVAGTKALIVLNKSDMVTQTQQALETLQLYCDTGYALITLCAKQDVTALRPYLGGHTSVLVGQSGMGKSSIINALLPDVKIRTAAISTALDSGTHTTTAAHLYHLDANSHLIDSPGLQEFGLHHFDRAQIEHAFIEFRPYLGTCKFNDCKHQHEPGCRVLQAVSEGKINARRLTAYHALAGC
jgi:ribosome biogenesis GTPase